MYTHTDPTTSTVMYTQIITKYVPASIKNTPDSLLKNVHEAI